MRTGERSVSDRSGNHLRAKVACLTSSQWQRSLPVDFHPKLTPKGSTLDGNQQTAMAERGLTICRHRVLTLMRVNGLRPVWRRKFVHTTDTWLPATLFTLTAVT